MDKTILKQIGLTDHEITIYLTALELGESLASKISEKIRMNRTHVYDILEGLISKGLVSYVIKSNKRYFSATDPHRLVELVKEKEKSWRNKKKK